MTYSIQYRAPFQDHQHFQNTWELLRPVWIELDLRMTEALLFSLRWPAADCDHSSSLHHLSSDHAYESEGMDMLAICFGFTIRACMCKLSTLVRLLHLLLLERSSLVPVSDP